MSLERPREELGPIVPTTRVRLRGRLRMAGLVAAVIASEGASLALAHALHLT